MTELLLSTYILLNLFITGRYIYTYKGLYCKRVISDVCLNLIFGVFIFAAKCLLKDF